MQTVRLALHAMSTRFELVLQGSDDMMLRAAGEEALAEISRLDRELSFYNPASVVNHINRNASKNPVRVHPGLYTLLKTAEDIYRKTRGAFDVTVGPLMRCWGFVRDSGGWPEESARKEALEKTGMKYVALDDQECSIAFKRDGMAIDLGAIGKGYAIEEATKLLQECGITSALLHGGTSTMTAIGLPSPTENGWPIGIANPQDQTNTLTSLTICDEAFSVSAPHGKAFRKENKTWGHVIDPRIGYPVQGAVLTAVAHASATVCDAVSTALLAMEPAEVEYTAEKFQDMRVLCAYTNRNSINLVSKGFQTNMIHE